ncbi:MAG: phenylalanine--tRNA ligase subunit beta [Spirochaetes bacterium]|jgi:phenylalanyl-tRNA synthetase beta chain|nr:phenylalanine--tRNA ligase subunit beta [Spirochaetota bacterium]
MWLSLNILKTLVSIDDLSPEEISARLTMSTAETEGTEEINGHLKTTVTAKLLEVNKHTDSDHLTVVKADTGTGIFTVVCGAPNHKAGDIAALALEGTRFTEDFVIKKCKIRGQESCGMLCSEKELGLSEESAGILIFPEGTPIGKPLSEIYPDRLDVRIEIDNKSITHRPDLWGHIGFAREISAIFDRKLINPVDYSLKNTFSGDDPLHVSIECPDAAQRYCGLVIKNIRIEESPEWLKSRIVSIGMRPINNIVDITNYVMAEIGEPMHAFSRKKLAGNSIIVRMANTGETLTTLDGGEHILTNDDIVIADKENPIALAGVMGGGNSEIDDDATEIILEAATFDPVHIRKTAHRYNLRTDAAMRFEKSLDAEICEAAIIRCYQLIKEIIPEAEAASSLIDAYPKKNPRLSISIHCNQIRKLLGEDITDERIIGILTSLEYDVENSHGSLSISVPSYRATKDIEIDADIVEEVGRIFGYDNITPRAPFVPCTTPEYNLFRRFERRIKEILSYNCGLSEVYNYSFVGEELYTRAKVDTKRQLRLKNPLSIEHDRLRDDMVPAIIQNIRLNSKNFKSFGLFEIGRVYLKKDRNSTDLAEENFRITGSVFSRNHDVMFYEAKTIVTTLFKKLRIKKYDFKVSTESPAYVHPVRSVDVFVDGSFAGRIFELSPVIQASFDFKGRAAIFDIDINMLFTAQKQKMHFQELQKYPDVNFEISVVCAARDYARDIIRLIKKTSTNDNSKIKDIEVVAVYEGDPLPTGKKSVSLKIVFNGGDHTLTSDEIETLQKQVIATVNRSGYELR